MSLGLETLASCFQGLIPATLYTASADGVPNAAYLSRVDYVDPAHVALSFQFFNKTIRNIRENPFAATRVVDPRVLAVWNLDLAFLHSETTGPIFEAMDMRLEAIASMTGMTGVFKLRAADVYGVLAVRRNDEEFL